MKLTCEAAPTVSNSNSNTSQTMATTEAMSSKMILRGSFLSINRGGRQQWGKQIWAIWMDEEWHLKTKMHLLLSQYRELIPLWAHLLLLGRSKMKVKHGLWTGLILLLDHQPLRDQRIFRPSWLVTNGREKSLSKSDSNWEPRTKVLLPGVHLEQA